VCLDYCTEKCSKRLNEVLRKEQATRSVNGVEIDTISELSGGDVRAAINDLQFRASRSLPQPSRIRDIISQKSHKGSIFSSSSSSSGSSSSHPSNDDSTASRGDVRISSVHCIAKIIHGSKNGLKEGWDPEALAGQCEMGVDGMASFLQHNAVEFYSECDEVAAGLQSLSDADLFIARQYDTSHVSSKMPFSVEPYSYIVNSFSVCLLLFLLLSYSQRFCVFRQEIMATQHSLNNIPYPYPRGLCRPLISILMK
jgi:hypothetical protein